MPFLAPEKPTLAIAARNEGLAVYPLKRRTPWLDPVRVVTLWGFLARDQGGPIALWRSDTSHEFYGMCCQINRLETNIYRPEITGPM